MHCNYGAVHSSHQPKATQQTDPAQQFEPVAIVSCSGDKCSEVHGQAAFSTLHAAHNHNIPDIDDIKHECFFVESRYLDVDRPDLMPARLKRNVLVVVNLQNCEPNSRTSIEPHLFCFRGAKG